MNNMVNTSKELREDAVYYEDFMHLSKNGNDYPAIKAAHDYANLTGKKVIAGENKSYTITDLLDENGNASTIKIKTDVDFCNAKILIDDTVLESFDDKSNLDVFTVVSDYDTFSLTEEEISDLFPDGIDSKTLKKINWKYGFPAMLVVKNVEQRVYKRWGSAVYNDNPKIGSAQTELTVIDKDGNIDPETSFMFDYKKVTDVTVYRIDETPITVTGGVFTTKASSYTRKVDGIYKVNALHRGLCSQRSNVTFKNIEHYVTNEVQAHPNDPEKKGAGYDGFFRAQNASDVTFENCTLTARRYYYIRGSYDLNAGTANRVTLKNCTQTNFYVTDEYVLRENGNPTDMLSMQDHWYWGVCGTSGCKNLTYDGSTLTRFDSHTNLYNGKIINSKIMGIQLVGGGDMLIENTEIVPVGRVFVNLRVDYGATWKGNITIKNCKIQNRVGDLFCLVYMIWKDHDFGYASYMPNITIDGIDIMRNVPMKVIEIASDIEENICNSEFSNGEKNKNPLHPAQFITVKNKKEDQKILLKNLPCYENINVSLDTIEFEK